MAYLLAPINLFSQLSCFESVPEAADMLHTRKALLSFLVGDKCRGQAE